MVHISAMNCITKIVPVTGHLFKCRHFSNAQRAVVNRHSVFTSECDPRNHSQDHLGLYYRIPDDVFDRVFKFAGFLTEQMNFMKLVQDRSIMIRKPALDIINYLKRTDFNKPANKYVIYGKYGFGKTYTLNHVLHYAHLEQFLLIHLDWNASRWFVNPKDTSPSERKSDRIDFPTNSAMWLQQFRAQNASILLSSNLTTTQKYTWSLRETTEAGEPLTNVIEHGLARIKHASDCIAVVLKELEIAANAGKVKILYSVDIVNCFYRKPRVKYPNHTFVPVEKCTIGRAFKKLFTSNWKNAAVVVAVDTRPYLENTDQPWQWKWKGIPALPKELLTYEGFNDFDPFLPIRVDKLSEKEAEAMLDYLKECNFLSRRESFTQEGRSELKFMSAYNAGDLLKLCASH